MKKRGCLLLSPPNTGESNKSLCFCFLNTTTPQTKRVEKLKISIEKTIIPGFKTGGFNLTYDSFIYIESIAKLLNSNNDLQLIVAGHTDNIGNYNYNLLLS